MHTEQRLKSQIDNASFVGLSVSSKRVRELKIEVTRAVSKHIEDDGVVVPPNMR